MSEQRRVTAHYSQGNLMARLRAALADDGANPGAPSLNQLAPYDQFHGRGIEATLELAALMPVRPLDHLLDVGSGLGGPARIFADRFGCRITGVDLTPEFCDVARTLTRSLGLDECVDFACADALAMPFDDGAFDGAYSMNVSMNIADKAALYREIHRVLKPGGWLLLSELAQGSAAALDFPTPWAASADASFLSTLAQTLRGLREVGFEVLWHRDTLAEAKAFGQRSRAAVERGEKPPHRAVMLMHGDIADAAMANTARAMKDGRIVPIELMARKRG